MVSLFSRFRYRDAFSPRYFMKALRNFSLRFL